MGSLFRWALSLPRRLATVDEALDFMRDGLLYIIVITYFTFTVVKLDAHLGTTMRHFTNWCWLFEGLFFLAVFVVGNPAARQILLSWGYFAARGLAWCVLGIVLLILWCNPDMLIKYSNRGDSDSRLDLGTVYFGDFVYHVLPVLFMECFYCSWMAEIGSATRAEAKRPLWQDRKWLLLLLLTTTALPYMALYISIFNPYHEYGVEPRDFPPWIAALVTPAILVLRVTTHAFGFVY